MPLVDTLNPTTFKVNPTIAAGDFQVSTDNGAFVNLTTLPVVQPAGSILVKVNLSAAEMNGDKITVRAKDVAGNEWEEALVFLDVPVTNIDTVGQILRNRRDTDPSTGILTVYDDVGVPLLTAPAYEDVNGSTPYNGGLINRVNRLT